MTGAIVAGIGKTAFSGLGTVAVAIFALVLPARDSTGTLLMLLLVGDLIATWTYRHTVAWKLILRLVPPVLVGLAIGAIFLRFADNLTMKRTIGGILLALLAMQAFLAWRKRRAAAHAAAVVARADAAVDQAPPVVEATPVDAHAQAVAADPTVPPPPVAAPAPSVPATDEQARATGSKVRYSPAGWFYGSLAGFTTMVANSGAPPFSLYLLQSNFKKLDFLGTTAWFFFAINLTKLPIAIGVGVVNFRTAWLWVALIPAVLAGCFAGKWIIKRVSQRVFEVVITTFVALSSAWLLIG